MQMDIVYQIVVATTALIGAVLGVVNLLHQLKSDSVRLKLTPLAAHRLSSGPSGDTIYFTDANKLFQKERPPESIGFHVVNLSLFPVTVSEIGFNARGSRKRCSVHQPKSDKNGSLPLTMDSRTSATFYVYLANIEETTQKNGIDFAYVKTECGIVTNKKSSLLSELEGYLGQA